MTLALTAVVAAAVGVFAPRMAIAEPQRIVSINACADQLLLALADPKQIAALTRYSSNPMMSAYRQRAKRFRQIAGTAEEVLKLKPDLVLAGAFTRRATRVRLAAFGIPLETLRPARSLRDARDLIARVAALTGQRERGIKALAELDAAVQSVRALSQGLTALNLQRRGFTAGAGTLLDDLLRQLGVANAARDLGVRRVGRTTLEHVVKLQPDVLIVSDTAGNAEDQGAAILLHPALRRVVPDARRVVLPARFVICGGPQNSMALRVLEDSFARIVKQR
ncbi:MAG: ABC transporter substrate-binding protein [Pseudomonadota bacterium]